MATSVYALPSDITDWLSAAGKLQVLDDNNDKALSSGDSAIITRALAIAAQQINNSLVLKLSVPISQEDNALNETLRYWTCALAVEWLCERKGKKCPEGFKEAANRVREDLAAHTAGEIRIAGLTYPGDDWPIEQRGMMVPRVANPTKPGSCRYIPSYVRQFHVRRVRCRF